MRPPGGNQHLLVTYAVLTGLTPLIPVPFLDDVLYTQLLRTLTRRLAAAHGQKLSSEDIKVLSELPGGGCALGCLGGVLLYPLRKLLAKVFFFLEWKRAADIISRTFYHGFLLETALESGAVRRLGAKETRAACDRVLARTNTSLVNRAAFGVVRQSHGLLRKLGGLLQSALPHRRRHLNEEQVAEAVDSVEKNGDGLLGQLVGLLERAILALPAGHLAKLEEELRSELAGG